MAPETLASEAWVWNSSLGVYYQVASNMYALPSDGGAWVYLTASELATCGEASHSSTTGDYESKYGTATTDSATAAQREEGEVENDVGWGGLMDPQKLARVVQEDQRKKGMSMPSGDDHKDRESRHPAYSNGYGYGSSRDHDNNPGRRHRDRDQEARDSEAAPYGERSHYDYNKSYERDAYVDRDDPADRRSPTPELDPNAHILRLVVRRSKALEHGAVAILDRREGGIQLGRDRCERGAPARVRVREMEVSKTHAVIYFGRGGGTSDDPSGDHENGEDTAEEDGWWIVDLGSTLGTYVAHRGERDAKRLSEPKCSSPPYPLIHLSVLTIGTTTFTAHIHDDWPCGECQIAGNVQIALDDGNGAKGEESASASPAPQALASSCISLDAGQRRGERQLKRKLEMSALKATLLGNASGNDGPNGNATAQKKATYTDRSAQRRRLHGSSPPRWSNASTSASTAPGTISRPPSGMSSANAAPVGPSAVSRSMLAKHGWTPGQGLGRDGAGRAEPVATVVRNERVGLGAKGEKADVGREGDGGWKARGMRRRWDEAAR